MQLPNEILFPEIERLLSEGHEVMLRTKGSSMFPFIVGDRDSVLLQRNDSVRVGDIVLAHLPDNYVLHRVYRTTENGIFLMGDGNLCATERCLPDAICGKVKQIIRRGQVVECDSLKERWLADLWRWLLPVRKYILGIWRMLR